MEAELTHLAKDPVAHMERMRQHFAKLKDFIARERKEAYEEGQRDQELNSGSYYLPEKQRVAAVREGMEAMVLHARGHYWDSVQPHRDTILQHIEQFIPHIEQGIGEAAANES